MSEKKLLLHTVKALLERKKGFGTLREIFRRRREGWLNKAQNIKYFNIIFISMGPFHINCFNYANTVLQTHIFVLVILII